MQIFIGGMGDGYAYKIRTPKNGEISGYAATREELARVIAETIKTYMP